MDTLASLLTDEEQRRHHFPVAAACAFFANAGVAPLPRVAVDAMTEFLDRGSQAAQEHGHSWQTVQDCRVRAAALLGVEANEIALLGPTSLGLSLVARGLDWQRGDEVVFYGDDYPANVYPWRALEPLGVRPVPLETERAGEITWGVVEAALSPRTRLVSLASCHFLSGYRIDVDGIGRNLHERGILFCLDGIQTLGAFPTPAAHVDFLSADSHKWMLGPVGAGIFYVRRSLHDTLHPLLLGSWNVVSPGFIAQPEMRLEPGARRYEPGTLNLPGIYGMNASLGLLLECGTDAIAARILRLRQRLLDGVLPLGFTPCIELSDATPSAASGIVSLSHPACDLESLWQCLRAAGVITAVRQNRAGEQFIRFAVHFYNSEAEIDRAIEVLAGETQC